MSEASGEMSEPSVSVASVDDRDETSTINTSNEPQVEFSQSSVDNTDRPTSASLLDDNTAADTTPATLTTSDDTAESAIEHVADTHPSGASPPSAADEAGPTTNTFEEDAAADSNSTASESVESHELTYSTVSGPSSLTNTIQEPIAAVMRQAATISTLHHTGEQHGEAETEEMEMEMVMETVTDQQPASTTSPHDQTASDAAPRETQQDTAASPAYSSLPPTTSALPAHYAADPLAEPASSRPITTVGSSSSHSSHNFIPPSHALSADGSGQSGSKHFPADFAYAPDSAELSRPLRAFHLSPQYVQLYQSFAFNVQQRYNLHYIDTHTLLYIAGNTAQLHDYQTGKKLVVHGHTYDDSGGVASIALHPSRSCFAVAEKGAYPNIYIYSYPQLQVIRILRRGTEVAYSHIEFNGNGDKLASVGSHPDYTLAVWEWGSERVILKTKAFSQAVYRVSFAPSDDGRLITAGVGHIRFWDMARTFTGLKLQGAIGKFGGVELSDISAYVELPDGRVLSGSESGRLLMWDGHLIQYQVVQLDDSPCHAGEISVVRLRAGGSEIVTAGADGWVRVWSYAALEYAEVSEDDPYIRLQPLKAMQIDTRCRIVSLVDGEDDEWLIQDSHGAIHAYNQVTEQRRQILSVHAGAINALVTSPNSHTAITAGEDCTVRCYDFYTGRQLYTRTFNAAATALLYAPLSADAQQTTIVAGFADGTLRILHRYLEAFQVAAAFKPHRSPIRHIAINYGGTILATAASQSDLFFFAINANSHCSNLTPIGTASFSHNVAAMNFSLDGRKLLLACGPTVVEVDVPAADGWEGKERDSYSLDLPRREWRYEIREKGREDDEDKSRDERDADDKRRREREEDMTDEERERERSKRDAREERRKKRIAKRKEEEDRVYHVSTVLYAPNSTTSFYFTLAPPPNSAPSAHPVHKTETLYHASFSSPLPSRTVPLGPSLGYVTTMSYSPSQSYLLLGSSRGCVQVRSLHDLLYCFRLQSHDSGAAVSGLGGSFDEQFVLSCGADGQLFCWLVDAVGGLAMVDRTVEQLALVEKERRGEERKERAKKRAEDDDRRKKERKAKAAGKKLDAKDKVESKETEADDDLSENEAEENGDDLSHLSVLLPAAAVITTAPTAPNNASSAAPAALPLPQPALDSLSTSTAAGVSDVADTLNATSYSIEEAKAKAEEDDKQLDLQRQQQSIGEQMEECRTQYNRLLALKQQYDQQLADTATMLPGLPASSALDPALFDLDPDLPTHIHQLTEEQTSALQDSLAYEIELHQLQLAKLQRHFLEPVQVESFVVRPFDLDGLVGGDGSGVWSYRVGKMPAWLVDEIAAVHKRVEEEEASKRRREEERQRRLEAEQKEAQHPTNTAAPDSPTSSRKPSHSATSPASPSHSSSSPDSRYQQRQQRQQQIDQLLAQRPDPSLPSPAHLSQLATVQAGIGDYKLKSAADYIVPEERKVNVDRKRRRMLLLVDAMYAMKQQFNGRLDEMRQLKLRLTTSLASDVQRVNGIVTELRAAGCAASDLFRARGVPAGFVDRLERLVVGEVRGDEWPEKRGEFSEAELHSFVAKKKLEEQAKQAGSDQQSEEASRPTTAAAPAAAAAAGGSPKKKQPQGAKEAGLVFEAEEKQQLVGDNTRPQTVLTSPRNARKQPSILAATRTHLHLQQLTATLHSLLNHLYTSLRTFNHTLHTLATTRLSLSDDLLNAQLRLLTYHEELTVLKEYEEKEQTLEERGRRGKDGRRQLEAEMADVERTLNARMRDMTGCHDKDKALLTEFVTAVGGEKNEFYSILLRLYRRKIKRRNKAAAKRTASATDKPSNDADGKGGDKAANKSDKPNNGDGDNASNDNNNSSNNSDSDDSDDDSDTESVLSTSSSLHSNSDDDEDEVCPPHCPTVAYERTIELRERRVENEEVMEGLQKAISDMGKMYERLMAKVKTMEKEAKKLDEEMQIFQSDKQKALNQIEVSLPLQLSQIVHLQANDLNNNGSTDGSSSGGSGYYQLPGQLQDCIVFPLAQLNRVKQREQQLIAETHDIDTEFHKVRNVAKSITKEMEGWQQRIGEESKRCENVQLLKFGRLVDLSFLLDDDGEWSKATVRMQGQLREMEADSRAAVRQWEGEISQLKQQYEQLLVTNTALLEDVAQLTSSQYQLEGKLNSTNSILAMGLTDNAAEEADRAEKDELCRLVEMQEREIEALKAEMSVLRRKGGHVYAV